MWTTANLPWADYILIIPLTGKALAWRRSFSGAVQVQSIAVGQLKTIAAARLRVFPKSSRSHSNENDFIGDCAGVSGSDTRIGSIATNGGGTTGRCSPG